MSKRKERAIDDTSQSRFACEACYKRRGKCVGGRPCHHCSQRKIDCKPSPIETTNRPRKKRFSEAVLLDRIKRYERALASLGADVEAIRDAPDGSEERSTSPTAPVDEYSSVLSILDIGEDQRNPHNHDRGNKFYDRIFKDDDSSWFFAVDSDNIIPHPAPFDMIKLWQVYLENVHPINKFIHAPSFQRLLYSYGTQWNVAPPSHQALCYAVYLAAVVSLSTEECEVMLFTKRQDLIDGYRLATQIHLRRAGLWKASDLSVFQALIILLSSMQNFYDSRTVVCFTAAAERIARRMGLHCDAASQETSLVERETRVRLWWEFILLDSRAVERSGLGTSVMTGNWKLRLPFAYSDTELDCMGGVTLKKPMHISIETILFLIRCEGACFSASTRDSRGETLRHERILSRMGQLEQRINTTYLCLCDDSNMHHRMARQYTNLMLSRLRMSAYIQAERNTTDEQGGFSIEENILKQCSENIKAYNQMKSDGAMKQFSWFMSQNLPIVAYIMMLRLLLRHTTGEVVEKAWKTLAEYKRLGVRLLMNKMTLKAWQKRVDNSPITLQEPDFIQEARLRMPEEDLPTIQVDSALTPSTSIEIDDADFAALWSEILSGEANSIF